MPKPILKVGGRYFLGYVLDQIALAQVDEIILAVGFQWEKIENIVGKQWGNIPVSYSIEDHPLGTGGAIKKAMQTAKISEALVMNGDTLLKMNPEAVWNFGREENADIAMTLKYCEDATRFGVVRIDSKNRVDGFEEKCLGINGLINTGLYYIKSSIFSSIKQEVFSFENDILSFGYKTLKIIGLKTDAYFIDMGVPDDFSRAQTELLSK
jgi:D-glycero-alpha-D-manno-heptose 1-phosphate guanylyltransferase